MNADDLLKSGKYEEYYSEMRNKYKKGEIKESELKKAEKFFNNYKKVKLFKTKNPKDFYSVLEVSKTASQEEIKNAYARLTRIYHPDANKIKESAECFAMINNAYSVLSDQKKRREYDLKSYLNDSKSNYNRSYNNNSEYSRSYNSNSEYKRSNYNNSSKTQNRKTRQSSGTRNVKYNFHSQRWEEVLTSEDDFFYDLFTNLNNTNHIFNQHTRNRNSFSSSNFNTNFSESIFNNYFQNLNSENSEIDPGTLIKIIILIFIILFTCTL
ncbi:Chaperone protein DnaJ 2 [Dictyocoela muelleri]|nr:Chaperone protein DnaJ 2 [Dictyocoela muelleri]